MNTQPPKLHASILQAIGNTPLVCLQKVVPPASAEVLVKLEYFNPTGSYKDRMALAMIEGAEARGDPPSFLWSHKARRTGWKKKGV